MATLRYKKRGNKWYVYEVHQYWDKDLKKPRQKSTYLGVSEEKDGSYSKPGKRVAIAIEKEILDCGDSYALSETAASIGLDQLIDESFGNIDSIMPLICFQIIEGSAMYNCSEWMDGNKRLSSFLKPKSARLILAA